MGMSILILLPLVSFVIALVLCFKVLFSNKSERYEKPAEVVSVIFVILLVVSVIIGAAYQNKVKCNDVETCCCKCNGEYQE